jgi:hypothetical protein
MSVTVQMTRLVPVPNVKSPGASLITVDTAQLSLVLTGTPITTLLTVHIPTSAFVNTSAGQVIVGASVSLTMTLNVQLVLLPQPSVAVQVTLLVPTVKVVPLAGEQSVVTLVQLSLAVAA